MRIVELTWLEEFLALAERVVRDALAGCNDMRAASAGGVGKITSHDAGVTWFDPPALAEMARSLERVGADFVVMACNTVHAFELDIRAALTKPFVSLIDEVVAEVRRLHPAARRVGVLATQGSRDANIFGPAFARRHIEVVELDAPAQARFMTLLYRIKAGDRGAETRDAMRQLGEQLVAQGAEVLVAGCTEVPLVLQAGECSRPLIDSTDVLAQRCVRYARRQTPLPD